MLISIDLGTPMIYAHYLEMVESARQLLRSTARKRLGAPGAFAAGPRYGSTAP